MPMGLLSQAQVVSLPTGVTAVVVEPPQTRDLASSSSHTGQDGLVQDTIQFLDLAVLTDQEQKSCPQQIPQRMALVPAEDRTTKANYSYHSWPPS
ncbi:hypothetical protein SKAU_G00286960 [Synaphobranchus kaupii]|uniref:Uncharacterized protein n=1 Tax=Synaphobranchus kaupii TaxID=118154 RepID=A0A9Q1EYA8_SYNKA|nr:hypothetical protein SKAU_G00286960 [Synaphobranchus kaupii]